MDRIPRDYATCNVLAWTTTNAANVEPSVEEEAGADADEPPDCIQTLSPITKHFSRAPVRRGSEQHESLLTKALQSHSDEDHHESASVHRRRRRSITSTISMASTADLTCDTGITTPPRTNSPSPRLPSVAFAPAKPSAIKFTSPFGEHRKDPAVEVLEKKRCISFACAAKPKTDDKTLMPPPPLPMKGDVKAQEPAGPKRPSIKFACAAKPDSASTAARTSVKAVSEPKISTSKSTVEHQSPTAARRSLAPRRSSRSPSLSKSKKWLTANSGDLQSECARFHEFASDEPQQDDWILRDDSSLKPKLTIDDTLKKENAIRKLGREAEEEAELEEEEEEEEEDDDEDEEDDQDDVDVDDEDEDDSADDEDDEDELENEDVDNNFGGLHSIYGWNDEASDGYKTDNEVGFADSDDEDDDGLVLWTTGLEARLSISGATPVCRRASVDDHSDSSDNSKRKTKSRRVKKSKPIDLRPGTPDLPDSTDFVCGTLDEDRPLEEAYASRLAARKLEKLHVIPQDIDPSFPTSEPEDEDDDDRRKGYGDSDDQLWLHGELEDIHQDRLDRSGRKKKSDHLSPKRYRSPPPKRRPSPAPKARGRSDRSVFDRSSPRRLRSPPPPYASTKSPSVSPAHHNGEGIAFKSLAFRPGLTHTKSLPRASAHLFANLKARRPRADTITQESHVRGAIDIVKGLEQKRQRRKEKFYQKYCSRARKEKAQAQGKRPPPGQGAERMREVGLIMAGKIGQGNYVLSV